MPLLFLVNYRDVAFDLITPVVYFPHSQRGVSHLLHNTRCQFILIFEIYSTPCSAHVEI